jgi:hypothetical protein
MQVWKCAVAALLTEQSRMPVWLQLREALEGKVCGRLVSVTCCFGWGEIPVGWNAACTVAENLK